MKNDDLIILDGCTFFYSDPNADVDADDGQGLFFRDVRHLSRWLLRVDGRELVPLTSRRVDYYSARVVGTREGDPSDRPPISIRRDRFVSEGVHEDIVVENLTAQEQRARLELWYASDFADVVEAQEKGNGAGRHWQERRPRSVTLWSERDGYRRGTTLTFSRLGRVLKERAVFDVRLRPRETWSLCVDMTPVVDGGRNPPLLRCDAFHARVPGIPVGVDEWLQDAPDLESDNVPLGRTYRQSVLDLAALRIRPDPVTITSAMPAGGLPWFMTVFGRDSLIAAYQALPYRAELARATLEALAELQATEWDNWRDAEPGKILHELRRGTLAQTGRIPHTPYYGSHDATMLWLIVLDEYERWSGDLELVRRLEPNARAALAWLEGPADLDGDGYVEYRRRSTSDQALDHHCWRDSENGILFPDGRRPEPPIAPAAHQGYAFDARMRVARLLRRVWRDQDEARRVEADAIALKARFNRDFWSPERRQYVLALDGEKRRVDTRTSDIGHLMWSGIVDERRAPAMVRRLTAPDMFSGWGIRSVSAEERCYHPLGYHAGTVWPHDTAIAAAGMRRYGFADEAASVCKALLDAAEAFSNQLPEVFAGFARDETGVPIEYSDALKPQSWAAGAPLHLVSTLLGLEARDRELRSRAHLPDGIGELRLRGLQFRGRRRSTAAARSRA